MKKISVIIICIFSASIVGEAKFKFDLLTVRDVVKQVRKSFGEMKSYHARFTIVAERAGKKTIQSGVMKYKKGKGLRVDFTKPYGNKIISNGKTMWIYIPSMNVVAEQDLKNNKSFFSSNTEPGLKRLFSKYHYKFASKEQPEAQKDGSKKYTLFLKQKERRSGYRTMKLWISTDYFIEKAEGVTSTGKKINISFTNVKKNINLENKIFTFDIPSNARVSKNPLMSEE